MKLRNLILSILLLAFSLAFFTSCGDDEKKKYPTVTINVYNWGEYISDGSLGTLDSNAAFEDYFNKNLAEKYKCCVEVNYTTYATNEDMYSKLTSGAGSYDVIVPSDYMIEKLINDKFLWEFDPNTLSNYKYISDEFKGLDYDKDEKYSVPYTYGMLGIIYNKEFVDEEDYAQKSWSLLWNEKYKGKILQFNNPRDAFATAMYYHGLDVNSDKTAVWDEALGYLKDQKPLLQGYVNDEIFNKMVGASAAIAPYYAGDFITMTEQNEDLDFYYPVEGTNYFVDAMCIPKNAKNKELALEYINFMLSEEPAIANAEFIGYASPNKLVYENEDYAESMGEYAMNILYGTPHTEINKEYNKNVGSAIYSMFDDNIQSHVNTLWESLKTENATEPWVHVTSGLIIVALLSLSAYTIYVKKTRSRDYRMRDKKAMLEKKSKQNIAF